MRRALLLLVAIGLPLVAAACGDDDHGGMQMGNDEMPMEPGQMLGDDSMPMGNGMPMDPDQMHGGDDPVDSPVPPGARRVDVVGNEFRFAPDSITARKDETLEITLEAQDIEHDLIIDELDVHVHAVPGEIGRGGFTASTSGTFTFYCSIAGHREAGMEGTLVVEER